MNSSVSTSILSIKILQFHPTFNRMWWNAKFQIFWFHLKIMKIPPSNQVRIFLCFLQKRRLRRIEWYVRVKILKITIKVYISSFTWHLIEESTHLSERKLKILADKNSWQKNFVEEKIVADETCISWAGLDFSKEFCPTERALSQEVASLLKVSSSLSPRE